MARLFRSARRYLFLLLVLGLVGAFFFWKSERRKQRIASVQATPPISAVESGAAASPGPPPVEADRHPLLPPFGGELPAPRMLPRPAEPSGGTYLEELGGFLVADDESTLGEQRGIYFLERDAEGELKNLPVRLGPGAAAFQWDDLEAVAASPDHVFFLASHAYDSSWRQRLCHASRPGLSREVKEGEPPAILLPGLWCLPERDSRVLILGALASAVSATDVDLEGMVWAPKAEVFYLGLRKPLAGDRAILLAMDPRGDGGAAYPTFSLAHTLDLERRGVRGLTFLDPTRLLIAAGPMGDEPGRFDLFLYDLALPEKKRAPRLLTPSGFPPRSSPETGSRELRIEGLAFDGEGVLILCDSGEWPEEQPPGAPAFTFYLPLP